MRIPRRCGALIPAWATGLALALSLLGPADRAAAQEAKVARVAADTARAAVKRPESSCVTCHLDLDERYLVRPAERWEEDVHASVGLGCEDCHGGDPSPSKSDDEDEAAEAAMDPARGFRAPPDRLQVAGFCARCHSDPNYMKRFNPKARIDQLAEYRTSVHGILNAKGDKTPATCIDCHGSHGVQHVDSPKSPAHATNVPKLCADCHSDAEKMAPYKVPTNQYASYMKSVHATALFDAADLSAPACNDCHGNHGATPPEVESVAHVCSHCHGREGKLFHESFKRPLFAERGLPDCMTCHDHHLVRHPTPELFHGKSAPSISSGAVVRSDPFEAVIPMIAAGDTVSGNWRVVMSPHVPATDGRWSHRVEIVAAGTADTLVLDATVRPGPQALPPPSEGVLDIGLRARLAIHPLGGLPVEAGDALVMRLKIHASEQDAVTGVVVRDVPGDAIFPHRGSACLTCHEVGDSCDVVSEKMYATLRALDREIRAGGALLHRAELAGMEVSVPQFELKRNGITAAVESKALVHSFDYDRLIERAAEGRVAAAAALKAGNEALDEIQVRRKGLAVSLVLIAMVLVGLHLKIRQVDQQRQSESKPGGGP